ncbi:MAG: PAS domain S-box protein, partial [Bacteroidota bacterium]|nr:PAS domain S-box protein [Bacteroidota bacterium]
MSFNKVPVMRWPHRLLLPITIPIIGVLMVGGASSTLHKRALEVEFRTNGDDMILIASYRDSVQLFPERSAYYQHALRQKLSRPHRTPYRGTPSFIDSLGLWAEQTFLLRCRADLAALGAHQTQFLHRIKQVDTLQTLFLLTALVVALAFIPFLLLYRRDLKHRLHLLAKLQESETRYRELVEHMPDLIQSVASDGRFVYVNRYWHQVMGYSKEELPQLRIWDIVRPDQLPKCKALFNQAFRDRQLFNVETVFVTKLGEEIHVSGNVTVHPDPITGEPVTRALFRDITAQKQQLTQLQYQEALASAVSRIAQQLLAFTHPEPIASSVLAQLGEVLNADAMYIVALPDGHPHAVALWTREAEAHDAVAATFSPLHWAAYPLLGERLSAIAIVEATATELAQAALQGDTSENCFVKRNVQSLLWVPLTRHGQLWGFIGVEDWKQVRAWTPTERTALESLAASLLSASDRAHAYRQLQRFAEDILEARNALEAYAKELRQANEELQERNAEKDRIMSIISHDLRSPLSGVRGLAEILQSKDAENPALVQEFARLIQETIDRVLTLVNDLLEVARLESGRVRLHLVETELCELSRSAFRIMDGMARSKGITLRLECPDTPVPIIADPPKLTQVINNLLSNAIKFTSNGGQVTLRIRPAEEQQKVELQVEDTGIG